MITLLETPEQAEQVRELFLSVYGEKYPIALYYQPELLLEESKSRRTICALGLRDERVAAFAALYHSTPSSTLLEIGAGLVAKEYRREGLVNQIAEFLLATARREGLSRAIFGESVCNHTHTQKVLGGQGFVDTIIEIDLMPAEAYVQEQSAGGRVSTVLSFQVLEDRKSPIYLPERYREQLIELYNALSMDREFLQAPTEAPDHPGKVETFQLDSAGLHRLFVEKIGHDLQSVLHPEATIVQLFLPLASPDLGYAVETARRHGFFFAGLAPEWLGGDTLLMQKVNTTPQWDEIKLYSDLAKQLLDFIRRDAEGLGT